VRADVKGTAAEKTGLAAVAGASVALQQAVCRFEKAAELAAVLTG
jgi:hypothetical protein